MFSNYFDNEPPILVGTLIWRKHKERNEDPLDLSGYYLYTTNKWYAYVPEVIFVNKKIKVLIVDDFAMSGDFIYGFKEYLLKNGFNDSNIKTACVITTNVAINNNKAPNYYWKTVDSDDFYFPWGKASTSCHLKLYK